MAYQITSSSYNFISMARLSPLVFLFWMALLAPLSVSAVVVEGLFEVKMSILDESKVIRRAALDDGLIEVLIRVSGDSHILKKIKAPASRSYVQQYEYSVLAATAEVAASQQLWVRYNATMVLDFLRKQAIPVWGSRRTQAVIWLAIRDGNQRYILKERDISLIKSQADIAFNRRGIPAIWPKNDAQDQQTVYFADIWAGFIEPLKQASQRYASGPVIVANMGWDGQFWKGDWSLIVDDEVRRWSLSGRDYETLIARAIDLAADVVGKKFAVLESFDVSQQETLMVEIDQVKSVEDFRRVEKYLSSLSAVRAVRLSRLESERVFFDLSLRSKAEDLFKLIQSGTVITHVLEEVIDKPNEVIPHRFILR